MDEQNTIVGETLKAHQSARKHHACLNAKAEKMIKAAKSIFPLLANETTGRYERGHFVVDVDRNRVRQAVWPDAETVIELVKERNEVAAEINKLEKHLRELGMGEYLENIQ